LKNLQIQPPDSDPQGTFSLNPPDRRLFTDHLYFLCQENLNLTVYHIFSQLTYIQYPDKSFPMFKKTSPKPKLGKRYSSDFKKAGCQLKMK